MRALYLLACWSSPQARGCFYNFQIYWARDPVFPAGAGVFLIDGEELREVQSLPRRRGGVSIASCPIRHLIPSSPQARGCFRNGGSCLAPNASSPQARGCFRACDKIQTNTKVFPAGAGVFLIVPYMTGGGAGLPRRRGGVSKHIFRKIFLIESSPQARGCFPYKSFSASVKLVFPAGAGVFLCCFGIGGIQFGLPRRRGGVSDSLATAATGGWSSPQARGCFLGAGADGPFENVFPAGAGVFPTGYQ